MCSICNVSKYNNFVFLIFSANFVLQINAYLGCYRRNKPKHQFERAAIWVIKSCSPIIRNSHARPVNHVMIVDFKHGELVG